MTWVVMLLVTGIHVVLSSQLNTVGGLNLLLAAVVVALAAQARWEAATTWFVGLMLAQFLAPLPWLAIALVVPISAAAWYVRHQWIDHDNYTVLTLAVTCLFAVVTLIVGAWQLPVLISSLIPVVLISFMLFGWPIWRRGPHDAR